MIRTLCFTLVLATAGCAAVAVVGYSSPAPAATPAETSARPERAEAVRSVPATNPCRAAVWPHIPAECMKNDNEGRARRPVRVIPIYAGAQ